MQSVLASSVSAGHVKVFEQAFAAQLEQVDLSVVLMDMVDTCPLEALPFLAIQFDVEGYKGWRFCQTEQEQRDLLRRSIELHKYKGTRYAVAESLRVLGYNDVQVDDHLLGIYYDGSNEFDGTIYYSSPHWALFRVIIYLTDSFTWTSNLYPDIVTLVNEYKNVRSHLLDISAGIRINDTPVISDELNNVNVGYIVSDSFAGLRYDGAVTYIGAYTFSGDANMDELTITIQ